MKISAMLITMIVTLSMLVAGCAVPSTPPADSEELPIPSGGNALKVSQTPF